VSWVEDSCQRLALWLVGGPHVRCGAVDAEGHSSVVKSRDSIYHPSSYLSPTSTASSHDCVADVFTLLVVFGSNTSTWTATVTVTSLNDHFVCEMQYPIASRCFIHSNCFPASIIGSPSSPRCLQSSSNSLSHLGSESFRTPSSLLPPLRTGVLQGHS
jgi:hypothetical protein